MAQKYRQTTSSELIFNDLLCLTYYVYGTVIRIKQDNLSARYS